MNCAKIPVAYVYVPPEAEENLVMFSVTIYSAWLRRRQRLLIKHQRYTYYGAKHFALGIVEWLCHYFQVLMRDWYGVTLYPDKLSTPTSMSAVFMATGEWLASTVQGSCWLGPSVTDHRHSHNPIASPWFSSTFDVLSLRFTISFFPLYFFLLRWLMYWCRFLWIGYI
jgi:hypothetical protein